MKTERNARIAVNILLDGVLAALAVACAFWLADPAQPWPAPATLPLAGAVAVWLIGIPFGLSRLHWRFLALKDLALIGGAAVLTAALLTLLMVGADVTLPSNNFPVVLALALIVLLTAPRLLYRLARAPTPPQNAKAAQTALLVGAGETAETFLSALARIEEAPYRVTGLLALSARHTGRRLHGLDILGAAAEAEPAFARLEAAGRLPDLLIIVENEIRGEALRQLLAAAEARKIRVLRAPDMTRLAPADGPKPKFELRPVAIEDLLNRAPVALDRDGMAALIRNRRVVVTGAGGSIGSELARQAAALHPAELMLVELSEFALWQIDLELKELEPGVKRHAVIADVRDRARMAMLFQDFQPDVVIHAAALKHVPIVEDNPLEGLRTNVLGTQAVADAASASGASLMVLISTDKAVNPSSVMGASKRLAEMYVQELDRLARTHEAAGLRCVTVRFGNVLGSTGSVVPLFRRQLEKGGPLTVTHPDMQRYFMTVREAVELVLYAAATAGQQATLPGGGIIVLDMGEPVKIVELARQMIVLAGLRPGVDVKIAFTGLRPGEKLSEELFHGGEQPMPTGFNGLLMANPRTTDIAAVRTALTEISAACDEGAAPAALAVLARLVPEFNHNTAKQEDTLAVSETARYAIES